MRGAWRARTTPKCSMEHACRTSPRSSSRASIGACAGGMGTGGARAASPVPRGGAFVALRHFDGSSETTALNRPGVWSDQQGRAAHGAFR